VGGLVEWRRSVPYDEMPEVFAHASCFVLASLPTPFWEEQFGMVLAEAAASGLPVVAASSGAIPEVMRGHGRLFPPGDWHALAEALAEVTAEPPVRRDHGELADLYSLEAAAARYAAAYERVLSSA
jgi:glycosyltransferase involved in cell wall biosynthesis